MVEKQGGNYWRNEGEDIMQSYDNDKRKLKVLYVTAYSELYGANKSMIDMITVLKEKYNVFPYVLVNSEGELTKELHKRDICYIVAGYYICTIDAGAKRVNFRRWRKRVFRCLSYGSIIKKIRNLKIDIIHSNSSVVDIGYYASRKLKCPHIWHVREYGKEDYNLVQIDNKKGIRLRYINSRNVIAISQSIGNMLLNIDQEINVNVVYNGVAISERYDKEFCKNKVHFCVVGIISKNKNQMEAVKAANCLVKKGYHNFCLHIIGDGFKGEEVIIREYIKENELQDYIEMHGYRSNIDSYLKKMDVGIVTSYKEAFGRVTIEYMSNYMPVIGTNTGGTKELIKDGYNGFLYELSSSECLAEKMGKLIRNLNLLKELGKNARVFSEKFTVESNASQIYEIYRKI